MAFTAPTAADLRVRFPAFAAVGDAEIDEALADAASMVDDTWSSQADFTAGRMLYAAHILTLDGHGTGAEKEMAKEGALQFDRIKSGALELSRRGPPAGTSAAEALALTTYGRRFAEILRRNAGGPIVGVPV